MSKKAIPGWPFWAAAGLLAVLIAFFYYRDNRNYECEGCNSRRVENQAKLGIWSVFSFRISPLSVEERPSHLYRDYLASMHSHQWKFNQGSPYGVFGWGGCAVGGRKSWGNLAYYYENDPNFRAFVRRKEAEGKLASNDFVAAYLLEEPSRYVFPPPSAQHTGSELISREAAIAKEAPEVQRLRQLATALEKEFSPQ